MSDLVSQLKTHLNILRSAGIEFVPIVEPIPLAIVPSIDQIQATAPMDDRTRLLGELATEVSRCHQCPGLFATRTQTVFGRGSLSPDICFLGDAPGAEDDRTGQPLTGEAGALFDKILHAMGLGRDEVYLMTAVKCRPPGNRPPSADECERCRDYLVRQLELVKPRFICCLGLPAARTLLNSTDGLNALRGTVHDFNGVPVMCTHHPASLIQNETLKRDCWADMKKLMTLIGRPLPNIPKGNVTSSAPTDRPDPS